MLQLPAEEFVAGVAFSAAEGNVLLARVNEYLAADAERAEQVVPAAPVAPAAPRPPRPVADTTTTFAGDDAAAFTATHVVPAAGLLAWVEPDPHPARRHPRGRRRAAGGRRVGRLGPGRRRQRLGGLGGRPALEAR